LYTLKRSKSNIFDDFLVQIIGKVSATALATVLRGALSILHTVVVATSLAYKYYYNQGKVPQQQVMRGAISILHTVAVAVPTSLVYIYYYNRGKVLATATGLATVLRRYFSLLATYYQLYAVHEESLDSSLALNPRILPIIVPPVQHKT